MAAFSILGPLEARREGHAVALGEGRVRLLLAVLLLAGGRTVSRDEMVDALWGERPPATAAKVIQVYVSRLREALGREAIVTQGTGYAAAVDESSLDALRFERLAAEGAALAAADPGGAVALLDEALGLWRGAPLADLERERIAPAVARLEELRLGAAEDRLEARLAVGPARAVVPELEELVGAHPLRERPVRLLMLALYRSGRQADALDAYRRTRALLADELGLEPAAELQELERAILNHDPALDEPAPAAAPALPLPATPTVGRERELEDVLAVARRPGVRLLTLTGPPGIGKTRLALEAAAALAPELGGAVGVVALASVREAELVLPTVAQSLGVVAGGAAQAPGSLAGHLGRRPYLLVLDNFEHVLGAAPAVAGLLAAAADLKVIVTSREPLHVAGEHEIAVRPLGTGAAIELFVQRAQAVRHDFALDAAGAGVVAEVCARLEGVPLAIELAAARTKVLPPAAILARLGDRLDLLRSDARDAPGRHQTLRATLDWSYDLLEPAEQRLLARLSVFAGGCGLDEIEAVAGDDALTRLGSLVDKSLVQREGAVEPRFTLLEFVREYAAERLATAGEEAAGRARHAAVFLDFAERWEPPALGDRQREALDRLELEQDNLRAAAAHLLDADPEGALRLVAAVRQLWHIRGPLAEGLALLEAALERAAGRGAARAKAHNGAGILAAELGDEAAARRHFEASAAAAREAGLPDREAGALANLANLDIFERDFAAARRGLHRVEEIWRELGDRRRLAVATSNLGVVALAAGEVDESRRLLRESVSLADEVGDAHQAATALRDLGRAEETAGELQAARAAFDRSLELMLRLGQRHGIVECVEGIAAVVGAEDPARAARLFGAGEALREELGARRPPDQQEWYERKVAAARGRIGAETFDSERERGRLLSLDEALAEAAS